MSDSVRHADLMRTISSLHRKMNLIGFHNCFPRPVAVVTGRFSADDLSLDQIYFFLNIRS